MKGEPMTRPGRPRLTPDEERSTPLSVRVSAKQFEETQRQAMQQGMTMAAWVRQMLAHGNKVFKNRP
jgi:hypothetical protein